MKYPTHNVHGSIRTNPARQDPPDTLGTLVYDRYLRADERPWGDWEIRAKHTGGEWKLIGCIVYKTAAVTEPAVWAGCFRGSVGIGGTFEGDTPRAVLETLGDLYRKHKEEPCPN